MQSKVDEASVPVTALLRYMGHAESQSIERAGANCQGNSRRVGAVYDLLSRRSCVFEKIALWSSLPCSLLLDAATVVTQTRAVQLALAAQLALVALAARVVVWPS